MTNIFVSLVQRYKKFYKNGFFESMVAFVNVIGHYMMEKTFGYQILLKVLTYNVSVRNILHITAKVLIIRGRKNCLYIYNIQAVILSSLKHCLSVVDPNLLLYGSRS